MLQVQYVDAVGLVKQYWEQVQNDQTTGLSSKTWLGVGLV